MSWLARLKKISAAPEPDPTEPTKPGFVGFVVPTMAHTPKIGADSRAANDPAPDPDRWCWPRSSAMNGAEIEAFTARVERFTDKGLGLDDANNLANKLVIRDRDQDDRRLCLECAHFTANTSCRNHKAADVPPMVGGDFSVGLQRCQGFALPPAFSC